MSRRCLYRLEFRGSELLHNSHGDKLLMKHYFTLFSFHCSIELKLAKRQN